MANSKKQKLRYLVLLDEDHINIINKALDSFSRLGMGQVEHVIDDYMMYYRYNDKELNREMINDLVSKLKLEMFGFPRNASHGIHSDKISDDFRTAWDIQQVLRNRLSWDLHPKGGHTVNFDTPMKSSKKNLIQIRKTGNYKKEE